MKLQHLYVEIRLQESLEKHLESWFEGLTLTQLEDGQTCLAGVLPDQAALHGLLERIRDLNLSLRSLQAAPGSQPKI